MKLSETRDYFSQRLNCKPPESESDYAIRNYKNFPASYWNMLESIQLERETPISLLDVGCGPGNWSLAVAIYNRNASVTGIDINERSLELALRYKKSFRVHNAMFVSADYREIDQLFQPESFDYVFASGALQYFHEEVYFRQVSKALKRTGKVVIFDAGTVGRSLQRILTELKDREFGLLAVDLLALLAGLSNQALPLGDRDHVVSFRRTKRLALRYGIDLKRVPGPKGGLQRWLCFPLRLYLVGSRRSRDS